MKKVLITGAGGFIGRNVAEYFGSKTDEYRVFSALHAELDLLDEKAVKLFISGKKIDLVVHCASVGGSRKTGYDTGATDVVDRNLRMFFNLVRALPASTRLINMGSGAEYGIRKHKVKEDEFDGRVPAAAYGYAKYVMSKYIEKTDNMLCLRIFGLYGKYEDYSFKFISNAIVKNLIGMPIVIYKNVVFDYLYMPDFLKILEYFIGHRTSIKHVNVTPTRTIDLLTIAKMINRVAAVKSEVRILNKGTNAEYSGNNSRLLKELGKFGFSPHEAAIAELYAYYAGNLDSLDLAAVKKDAYLKNCK